MRSILTNFDGKFVWIGGGVLSPKWSSLNPTQW